MLVLTRKSRESVLVGGGGGFERVLKVTVLEIQGSKVRLGFDVDASIPIHRAEVWERLHVGDRVNGDVDGTDRTTPAAVTPFT
jgi:carbon storage regulator CsrA